MDRHVDFLKGFCRICDEKRINLQASSIKTVKGNAKHIKKIYDIDISDEDPTKYSKYICSRCMSQIQNYIKALDKHEKNLRRTPNSKKVFNYDRKLHHHPYHHYHHHYHYRHHH